MIFISSLILSRKHFSQNFWCAPLARAVCANATTATSLPLPSIQLIIQCLTEAGTGCSTKRHMKHFSKTLGNHLPIRRDFFPPCRLYQQNNTNADLKGRWFFKSLVTVKMQLITTLGYSIPIQTSYKSALRGPKFYLWPCPLTFPFCQASLRPYSQTSETGTSPAWDSQIFELYCHGTL